jgi:hypothetical protein
MRPGLLPSLTRDSLAPAQTHPSLPPFSPVLPFAASTRPASFCVPSSHPIQDRNKTQNRFCPFASCSLAVGQQDHFALSLGSGPLDFPCVAQVSSWVGGPSQAEAAEPALARPLAVRRLLGEAEAERAGCASPPALGWKR